MLAYKVHIPDGNVIRRSIIRVADSPFTGLREHPGNKAEDREKKSIRHRSLRAINEPFTNELAFAEF